MSDFDTRRVGEIVVLEEQIQQLQKQCAAYKQDAERWTPKFTSAVDVNRETGTVSLEFGGKAFAATMTYKWLQEMDATTASTAVLETLCASHIIDRLRPLVLPELERIIKNANSLNAVGKW